MVNEAVLGHYHPIAELSYAHREIVVLEHADLIVLVEPAGLVPELPPQQRAEHRQYGDVEAPSAIRSPEVGRELFHLYEVAIPCVDLRFVARIIRNRTHQPDRGVRAETLHQGL